MSMNDLISGAKGIVILGVLVLTGVAVITQYKTTGLVDNSTADDVNTGLTTFTQFMSILAITIVAGVVITVLIKKLK